MAVSIKNVNCEFVLQDGADYVTFTEELQRDWNTMSKEEKKGWFTTKTERLTLDAQEIIENAIERFEEKYGRENCIDCFDSDEYKQIQELLNKITNSSNFDIYHPVEKIVD